MNEMNEFDRGTLTIIEIESCFELTEVVIRDE